jgi:hypothetical protein
LKSEVEVLRNVRILLGILFIALPLTITAQKGVKNGEWPVFGGDGGSGIIRRSHWCRPVDKSTAITSSSVSHSGLLVTKTLLFAGEGLTGLSAFRAHDKKTGEILWETQIPTGGTQTGLPITYMLNGRQYIVFAAAGTGGAPAAFVAYALPATERIR